MSSSAWRYERTMPLLVPGTMAIARLREAFDAAEFAVEAGDESGFEAIGPGMNSSAQHPLRGASSIRAVIADTQLTLYAELGALRRMQYFMFVLPCLLLVIASAFFLYWVPHGELFVRNTAPSLLLSLMLFGLVAGLWLHRRTVRALDLLLDWARQ